MLANPCEARKPSLRALRNDDRGAVMVIGLFMGLSLIGLLWFMIGIGQAIVFRDRGQEAADAMAMSVAAVDARGMDLISVINLISLALVGIYLLVQIAADAMMLAIVTFLAGFRLDRANTRIMQEKVLSNALPVLGASSAAVAVLTPWMGTGIIAPEVARNYPGFEKSGPFPAFGLQNLPGVGFSTAMQFPKNKVRRKDSPSGRASKDRIADDLKQQREKYAEDLKKAQDEKKDPPPLPKPRTIEEIEKGMTPEQKAAQKKQDEGQNDDADDMTDGTNVLGTIRLGLPVAFETNKTLCARGLTLVTDLVFDLFSLPSVAKNFIKGLVAKGANLYADMRCGNDPFPWAGPKKMVGSNGSLAMQVYGFANGTFGDDNESKVRLASRTYDNSVSSNSHVYSAQAEFFYNCTGEFSDDDCNGKAIGSGPGREHAVYWPGWKARLVKYKRPEQALFEKLVDGTQSALYSAVWDGMDMAVKCISNKKVKGLLGKAVKAGKKAYDGSDFAKKDVPGAANALKEKGKELFGEEGNYH